MVGAQKIMYKKAKQNHSRGKERIEKAARNNAKDLIWQIAIFSYFSVISIYKKKLRNNIVAQ